MIVFIALIIVGCNLNLADCYKPVMVVPGITFPSLFGEYVNRIKQNYPGIDVVMASCDPTGIQTVLPIWKQVEKTYNCKKVQEFIAQNPKGFHIIGISLGSVISRALIQHYGLPVDKFISVAGSLLGVDAIPVIDLLPFMKPGSIVGNTITRILTDLTCHAPLNLLYVSDVWRDSCKMDVYKKCNNFFPIINNEIQHNNSKIYKKNFLKIKKMYLVVNTNDDFVRPWQTGRFGYVDCNQQEVKMKDQEVYKTDSFGLRTLDKRGAIKVVNVSQPFHLLLFTGYYIDKYILPILDLKTM